MTLCTHSLGLLWGADAFKPSLWPRLLAPATTDNSAWVPAGSTICAGAVLPLWHVRGLQSLAAPPQIAQQQWFLVCFGPAWAFFKQLWGVLFLGHLGHQVSGLFVVPGGAFIVAVCCPVGQIFNN